MTANRGVTGGRGRTTTSPSAAAAGPSHGPRRPGATADEGLRSLLTSPQGLRQALLAKEILDEPVALRPPGDRPPRSR